jgi:elongator complex protein 2
MNKGPNVILANKNLRVNDEEEGGVGEEFDPMTVLTNVSKQKDIIQVSEPPVEDVLMARTLWPEQQKLYGHVFEVFCVASSHKGDCAASACKSKEQKYADINIWDLTKAQTTVPSCRLAFHKLTVVQLEFSKCD